VNGDGVTDNTDLNLVRAEVGQVLPNAVPPRLPDTPSIDLPGGGSDAASLASAAPAPSNPSSYSNPFGQQTITAEVLKETEGLI
jgi:hypothetical protein